MRKQCGETKDSRESARESSLRVERERGEEGERSKKGVTMVVDIMVPTVCVIRSHKKKI